MNDIINLEEKQKSSKLLFDGNVLHLYLDSVYLPDGKEATREYCRHIGAVCVVPLTDENEVICVKQYRYPVGTVLLEIPAGKLDFRGENPESAAIRELGEETGAACRQLTYLGKYFGSPAILDECIHMYLARGLEFGECHLDDDEFLQVTKIPLNTLVDMIMSGDVPDGKTQAAIMRVYHLINDERK